MKVLALMQNQWLRNAEHHQREQDARKVRNLALWWKLRELTIPFALFRGCRSGRVLSNYLGGPDITSQIIWEEASTRIGDKPSSCPPPEQDHIRAVLYRYQPDYVVTFGSIARDGLASIIWSMRSAYGLDNMPAYLQVNRLIPAPHPAARAPKDHAALKLACQAIRNLITNPTP